MCDKTHSLSCMATSRERRRCNLVTVTMTGFWPLIHDAQQSVLARHPVCIRHSEGRRWFGDISPVRSGSLALRSGENTWTVWLAVDPFCLAPFGDGHVFWSQEPIFRLAKGVE